MQGKGLSDVSRRMVLVVFSPFFVCANVHMSQRLKISSSTALHIWGLFCPDRFSD